MPNSIYFPVRCGDSNLKVSQTQGRRPDENDPFLNMGFKHWKNWVDKNGAKCNMGFGRITENTHPQSAVTVSRTPSHCDTGVTGQHCSRILCINDTPSVSNLGTTVVALVLSVKNLPTPTGVACLGSPVTDGPAQVLPEATELTWLRTPDHLVPSGRSVQRLPPATWH